MLQEKWVVLCRKCGWRKEVPLMWADLKPKYCGNKKCKCSFLKDPDSLLTFDKKHPPMVEDVPEYVEEKAVEEVKVQKKGKQWR